MTFTTKNLKDSQIELTVDLDKEDLFLYAAEAERKLAKEIKVGGFRPGKAPKEMVRKTLGEQAIREEALNLSVQSSLAKAMEEQKLDVFDQIDFKIKENSADRLTFFVKLLIFPEVKLGSYKGLSIKKNPVAVTKAEIGVVLGDVIKSRTVLKEVARPARQGDRVEINFEVKDQGVLIEGGKSENHPAVLGENKFVPGFEEQVVGMKAGEKKNFSLKVPADYYQKSIAGRSLDFEVVVKHVEELTVPKLTDDFVKSLGQFASTKELEASVRQGLTVEKEAKEKDRVRLTMLEKIAETTKAETPAVLVERRLDAMIQDFDNELHQQGMELGLYLAHLKKTQDDLRREWQAKAESQVKLSLIVRAIAKAEHLKVSDGEIIGELQATLQKYMVRGMAGGDGGGPEALQNIDPEKMKSKIHDLLLNEKVFEFLEKHSHPLHQKL